VSALVRVNIGEAGILLREFAGAAEGGATVDFGQFCRLLLFLRRRGREGRAKGGAAAAGGAGGGAGAAPLPPSSPPTPAALAAAAGEQPIAPPSPLEAQMLQRIFDSFDVHHEGRLHVREALVGLALLDGRASSEGGGRPPVELLRLAYRVLDEEGRGAVPKERLGGVLLTVYPGLLPARVAELTGGASGGRAAISEEMFLQWAAQPEVFQELDLFKERLLGLQKGDWLKGLAEAERAAKEAAAKGRRERRGGWWCCPPAKKGAEKSA
jgi:hypothetical protein